jgi:hypothetical protein
LLSALKYGIWVISFLLEVSVVVCVVTRRDFLRYLSLAIYMLCAAFVNCGQYLYVRRYGISSREYYVFYYYTESLLTILMLFVVVQLYSRVFSQMKVSRYIRSGATALLAITAFFSYLVVRQNHDHMTDKFVVEVGQNLYFVGVVLTYVLWGAIVKLGEVRTRIVQLILALGIYFSATAAAYALRNMFPALQLLFLQWVPPLIGTWLPLAWAYTFITVPEEAEMRMGRHSNSLGAPSGSFSRP